MKICHARTKLPKKERPVMEERVVVSTNANKKLPALTKLDTGSVVLPTSQTMKSIGKNILKILGVLVMILIVFECGIFYANHHNTVNLRGGAIADVVAMVNQERMKAGVRSLMEDPELDASAKAKCEDMVNNNYFDHISPTGKTPWNFMREAGFWYYYAGENLTQVTGDQLAMQALMNSPAHKQNILDPNYYRIGVAHCYTYQYDILVQHFGSLGL
jgi:uncharacterized protein YkwD